MKFLHNDSICITNVAEQELKVSSQHGRFLHSRLLKTSNTSYEPQLRFV